MIEVEFGLVVVVVVGWVCKVIIVSNPTQLSKIEVVLRMSWGCDIFKAKNIFILSQTEPWEILVRVANPSAQSVRVAKSRARILYTNTPPG